MSAQVYRRNATECLKLSTTMKGEEAQSLLRWIAIAWTDLADLAERNEAAHQPAAQPQPQEGNLDDARPALS
jgi:hypothetical protein